MSETRKIAAILVADVVGYSRLAGADEDRTLSRLRGLRSDLIDPAIAAHHGRIVKRTGDGSLVEFRSVVDAVRCAIEVQNGMVERNAGVPPERRIEFRVGIHLGDVVEESDGDLMGDGVNIAARLEGIAKSGAIAGDDAVEAVFFGNGNGLSALGQDAVHISMSTISVALSDRLAEAHRNAGQSYVAAPVFGRPEAAAAAKLFVVAAGPEATLARCQPLLDAVGQRTFVIGDKPSSANLVKLSGNFLLAAMIECLGEAFALVRKGGIDPHRYLEILTNTLFSAPAYKTYGTIIANQQYEPAGFKMSLGLKDVRLALAAADALATPMPVASLVHDHFLAGVAQGAADFDWSALARLAAANAGL